MVQGMGVSAGSTTLAALLLRPGLPGTPTEAVTPASAPWDRGVSDPGSLSVQARQSADQAKHAVEVLEADGARWSAAAFGRLLHQRLLDMRAAEPAGNVEAKRHRSNARPPKAYQQSSGALMQAIERAGLNAPHLVERQGRATAHSLRHTFASWLLQNGQTLAEVQDLLGHESLEMTRRYSHLATEATVSAAAETITGIVSKALGKKAPGTPASPPAPAAEGTSRARA